MIMFSVNPRFSDSQPQLTDTIHWKTKFYFLFEFFVDQETQIFPVEYLSASFIGLSFENQSDIEKLGQIKRE